MIKSKHRVQHTPSTAYTEYCIHRTLHHPKIDCLPLPASLSADHVVLNSPHSHNYELSNELNLSSRHASFPNYRLQIDHVPVLLQSCSTTACHCISNLSRSRPPSASSNSHYYGLQVRMIMASKCISKLAQSQLLSVSLNFHY